MTRHALIFALLSGAALLSTHCGGGDDASDEPGGGTAGTSAGSGGRGGSGARGGSSGRGGSNGDGGDGASSTSAGAGASAGGADAGSGSGGAGEGGGGTEPIALTVADSTTELIEADEGGTVTLGELTLVIPPDALEEDTEITIRGFEDAPGIFVLEPDGLEFDTPITARFTTPVAAFEGSDEPGVITVAAFETGALGEPLELVDATSVVVDDDDNYVVEGEIEHFSAIWLRMSLVPALNENIFLTPEDLTVGPAFIPVGVQFATVGMVTAKKFVAFNLEANAHTENGILGEVEPVRALPVGLRVTANEALGLGVAYAVPIDRIIELDEPRWLEPGDSAMVSRQFSCSQAGVAQALMAAEFVLSVEATASGYTVHQLGDNTYEMIPGGPPLTKRIELSSSIRVSTLDLTCLEQPSTLASLGAPSQIDPLIGRYKAAWQDYCFWLSNHDSCQSPNPARAIVNALDPVLEVGPEAAARLEAAFPCGDGPVGRTFCGTPGAFAEGDYVFVLATFGDDIPLEDETSSFQHAFVFDADGVAANNYVPPAEYPDDFFVGTDKWYQLFHTPGPGFALKVVDARISTSNPVASNARMVIAGRELSAFIPRAELDGTAPGFRVTTFRHEGDYGLEGGPWDASYYPPLDEPLMPAAAGPVIVLPEDE